MRQSWRSVVVYVSLLCILPWAVGCTSSPTPLPTPTLAPRQSTADEGPASCDPADTIKVGFSTDSPSFADKGPEGFDIDLMNVIASSAGLRIAYVDRPWATILDDLDQAKIAMAVGAIPIGPEADFSEPYFERGLVIVIEQEGTIEGAADLADKAVGVQPGSDGQSWCQNDTKATCISFANIDQAFEALDRGDLVAVICEKLRAVRMLVDHPQFSLRILPDIVSTKKQYGYRQYGIAVRKGCPALRQAIDEGLREARLGAYQQICQARFKRVEVCMTVDPALAVVPKTPSAAITATVIPPSPAVTATVVVSAPTPALVDEGITVTVSPATLDWETVRHCGIEIATREQETGQVYTIQSGDTLAQIAQKIYGRAVDYKAIYYYTNHDTETVSIDDPALIMPGWEIYLPTAKEVERFWASKTDVLPSLVWDSWAPIRAAGSSTVFPLTTRLAECFVAHAHQQGYENQVKIHSVGTFGGVTKFCAGEADLLNASVRIEASDLETHGCGPVEPIGFQVGTDAVSIVVSKYNSFIAADASITMQELRQILATAQYWSEVRADWPKKEIVRFYPSAESGTLAFVAELLFDEDKEALLGAPHVTASEDDAALAASIEDNPYGVGFFGYAYYRDRAAMLYALPVENKRPQPETVDSPEPYPLVRPLFIYTTAEILAQRPAVAALINFYLRSVNDHVVGVGYFPPSESDYAKSVETFAAAIGE